MRAALDPASPQAAHISHLWRLMFGVCGAVFLLVIGFLLYAVFRSRRSEGDAADPSEGRRMTLAVGGAVAATVATLFGLLIVNVSASRGLAFVSAADALTIGVIGHQW